MTELFSESWMHSLKEKWNADSAIHEPLQQAGFSASIAYGFKDEAPPRGLLVIENGIAVQAGSFDGEERDWDLRASREDWMKWLQEGFGLAQLGAAVSSGALEFAAGDYRKMIRTPSLSHPFLEHFRLMREIGV